MWLMRKTKLHTLNQIFTILKPEQGRLQSCSDVLSNDPITPPA
jgi:hypothetical protein